jgi:hypothetical protein
MELLKGIEQGIYGLLTNCGFIPKGGPQMPPGSFPGGMGGGMPPQMGGFPGMGGFLN